MIELKGKYGEGIYYNPSDGVREQDELVISQAISLLNEPFSKESNLRLMPDAHVGKGCTVGTTMLIRDKASPNLVGVDIGCGVALAKFQDGSVDYQKLDRAIKMAVPRGFNIHPMQIINFSLDELRMPLSDEDKERALKSLGTLGGGNHYIEAGRSTGNNSLYLSVHSGSRSLGVKVATYYQNLAYRTLRGRKVDKAQIIKELKEQGKEKNIEMVLRAIEPELVNKDMAYLEGTYLEDYLHDMKICTEYAALNRRTIIKLIEEASGYDLTFMLDTVHNYIDVENRILRKGSVSASKGEVFILPLNMRDGSLICKGKGNPDWNFSAPHGAGRKMSRTKAKELVNLEDYRETMEGIYSSTVNTNTLDESPFAYKNSYALREAITPTAEIMDYLRVEYNCKDDKN